MRPPYDDGALGKAGDDRRDGGARNAERGRAELAEDEDIVQNEVYENRDYARLHRQHRLSRLSERACVDLHECKRHDLPQHDFQITHAVHERCRRVKPLFALVDKLHDKLFADTAEHEKRRSDDGERDIELPAEGVCHAFAVVLPVKLRREDAGSRKAAEDAEVKNKQKLVDDRDAGHWLRPHLTDHDVVKQAHKVRYYILYEYGQHYGGESLIKRPVSYQLSHLSKILL